MKDINPLAEGPHDFQFAGHRLHYEVFGEGSNVLVYMHGLLLDSHLNRGIAEALADQGTKVVLFDLLGHGLSEKPARASEYRMDVFAEQVFGLLDHLAIEKAVVGGISLGANVSLEAVAARPERIEGLVIEMPVLEWAAPVAAMLFAPLSLVLRWGRPLLEFVSKGARRVPRSGFGPLTSIINTASNDPEVLASILHGVLLGPVAPTDTERNKITAPTLILAHRFDPLHPLDDADKLAKQLKNSKMVVASPVRLRLNPRHYAGEITSFLDGIWSAGTQTSAAGSDFAH